MRIFLQIASVIIAATIWCSSSAALAEELAGETNNLSWSGGGFVAVVPKYEGSKSYEFFGAPYIFPNIGTAASVVAIRGADDVRFRFIKTDGFVAGPLVGYKSDRDESDGAKLLGLGDVDGGIVLGGFAGYRALPWLMVDVSYHRTVTGDVNGGQLRFGLEYESLVSRNVTLVGRVGATFADDDYMAAYFGVSASQAGTSLAGLPIYNAHAGFKDVHVGLGAKIQFDDKWALRIGGRYARLVGDAADSPVIETGDQFFGFVNITYKFGR